MRSLDALDESRALDFANRLTGAAWDALSNAGPTAAILHGSLASGAYVPGTSDVDLLLVTERGLTDEEIGWIPDVIGSLDPTEIALDLRIVTAAVANAPSRPLALEFYFGRHPGEPIETESRVANEPDLAVELWVARNNGRSLRGPGPAHLIGPVPNSWLNEYGRRILERWLTLTEDDENATLMVLTACRIWHFAALGRMASKSEAGWWALDKDPSLTAIPAALRRRAGEQNVSIDPREIASVLDAAARSLGRPSG